MTPAEIAKLKPHPIFKDLPEHLKDPKCFLEVEEKLAKVMFSDHQHKTVKGFVKCSRCAGKLEKKRALLKELGFDGHEQYLAWKRVVDIIINKKNIRVS